jgi:hypothetical protein
MGKAAAGFNLLQLWAVGAWEAAIQTQGGSDCGVARRVQPSDPAC